MLELVMLWLLCLSVRLLSLIKLTVSVKGSTVRLGFRK